MKKKDRTNLNYQIAIIISIMAIIVFCIVSVLFGVMPLDVLPVNYIGAALSSLIGALITLVLLRGQTAVVEKKGKDIRILKKKTKVFLKFIKKVWKVWKKQKITIEEFQELTSIYYRKLMIYLPGERLNTIGNALSGMGKTIGEDNDDTIAKLRESIINIINELSDELDLGGQVDEEIMKAHEKIVFPLLFKNKILEEANKELPVDKILEEGKFEFVQEFRTGPSLEYLCFNFVNYKGCKIVIDGFNGSKNVQFFLYIDKSLHEFDKFRVGGKYVHRISQDDNRDLLIPIPPKPDEQDGEQDKEIFPPINLSDEEYMDKKYRTKRDFATIFAKRIQQHFDETKIIIDDNTSLNILKFLENYYKKQT